MMTNAHVLHRSDKGLSCDELAIEVEIAYCMAQTKVQGQDLSCRDELAIEVEIDIATGKHNSNRLALDIHFAACQSR